MDPLDGLRDRYLDLTRRALPERAAAEPGWPVRFDHCFMRIALDHAAGGRWTDTIASPAYKNLTPDQLREAIAVAERMLDGGPDEARALDAQSLAWRGKRPKPPPRSRAGRDA